jgi:zinc ribbon protein
MAVTLRYCTTCGSELAAGALFCGACGSALGSPVRRSAWASFRAEPGWLQIVAWAFVAVPMALFWVWSGSGWHVAGKIAATLAVVVALLPFMFA